MDYKQVYRNFIGVQEIGKMYKKGQKIKMFKKNDTRALFFRQLCYNKDKYEEKEGCEYAR